MKNITIIMYHYVRPIKGSSYPFIKGLELDEFKTQLNFLEKNYKIITMESLIEFVKKGISLPKNPCLLTFDDGYKDHYLYVFPELKKRKLQGSFFPAPKTIVEKKILDVNKIHFILAKEKNINFLIDKIKKLIDEYKLEVGSEKLNNFSDYWKKNAIASRWDPKEVVFVKRLLQNALPEKIRVRICNFLFEFYIKKNEVEFASELYMNSEELKEMINSNMYVGNHSYQHLWLNTLSKDLQEHEIDKSLNYLNKIGAPTIDWVMNYPYGAYNSNTIDILKKKGCCIGLTSKNGIAELKKGKLFELSRKNTNDFPKS